MSEQNAGETGDNLPPETLKIEQLSIAEGETGGDETSAPKSDNKQKSKSTQFCLDFLSLGKKSHCFLFS